MPDKKLVAGIVKQIEGDIVMVTIKKPGSGKSHEIDVNRRKLQKEPLKKGDSVTIDLTIETAIPVGATMFEIEEAIASALGQVKADLLNSGTLQKKAPAKRTKKA